jgi:pilus assembly protein CpaB
VSRGRRAVLLAGVSTLLGGLAASQVAGREAEIERKIGSPVPVVVAARDIARGARIKPGDLALRQVPERYVPRGSFARAAELRGATAAVAIAAGGDLHESMVSSGVPPGSAGLRLLRLVVVGSAAEMAPGSLVDILVTREGADGSSRTTVGLRRAEVVESRPAPAQPDGPGSGLPRAQLAIRATVAQAVALADAQGAARELRALPVGPVG